MYSEVRIVDTFCELCDILAECMLELDDALSRHASPEPDIL